MTHKQALKELKLTKKTNAKYAKALETIFDIKTGLDVLLRQNWEATSCLRVIGMDIQEINKSIKQQQDFYEFLKSIAPIRIMSHKKNISK